MDPEKLLILVDGLKIVTQAFVPPGAGPHPVLCICHGLPAGPRDPNDRGYQELATMFQERGFLTVIFNFRGVAESEGNLDLPGWTRDLSAAIGYATALPGARNRASLLGFSAGAAVAICVAAKDTRVNAVASCASPALFTFLPTQRSAEAFIAHARSIGMIRDPAFPPSLDAWKDGFRSIAPLNFVDCIAPRPLLIVHGDQDDVVPLKNAHLLYEKAGQPKELFVVRGAGHRLRLDRRAMEKVGEWIGANGA